MSALEDWVKGLSDWQSDALRRQVAGQSGDDSYAEIFQNAKAAYGIGSAKNQSRFDWTNASSKQSAEPAILTSIGPMNGVDRLANDQTMNFSEIGVTAVYGNNGVGKSGYSRVLKQLCRVVAGAKTSLRGNAFETNKAAPKIGLAYRVGDEARSQSWTYGDEAPSDLRNICVFDSAAARLYVNEQNEIDYLPYEVDLVAKHRQRLERVRQDTHRSIQVLEAEIAQYKPVFALGGDAYNFVSRLSSEAPPTEAEIRSACSWSQDLEARLKSLQERLYGDPETRAKAFDYAADRLRILALRVYLIERRFRDSAIQGYLGAKTSLNDSEEAVRLASELSLGKEPLSDTGSQAWRVLFDAARFYALRTEHQHAFVSAEAGDLCVLCQQPLSAEAADRLRRFDSFVSDQAALELQAAGQIFSNLSAAYERLVVPDVADVRESLAVVEYSDCEDILVAIEALSIVLRRVNSKPESAEARKIGSIGIASTTRSHANILRDIAIDLRKSASVEELEGVRAEISALEEKKRLANEVESLIGRMSAFDQKSRLSKLLLECSDASLARFITSLRRQFLTDALSKAIQDELRRLGLQDLSVTFSDRTRADKSFGGVALSGVMASLKNADILSEGEQRALALAIFIAEASIVSERSSMIIDDPVSSLDDARMRKVARRLAELASTRQVITFTHHMSFFAELRDAAAEVGTHHRSHYMFRGPRGFGTIGADSVPWELMKLKDRIAKIRVSISEMRSDENPEQYKTDVKIISTMIRESWERLVEEKLLHEVVLRFARPVHTLRLRGVSVSDEDFSKVYFAMKRASEWSGHDAPIGAPLSPPAKTDLEDAVQELEAFARDIDKARSEIESRRKMSA